MKKVYTAPKLEQTDIRIENVIALSLHSEVSGSKNASHKDGSTPTSNDDGDALVGRRGYDEDASGWGNGLW